MYDSAKSIHQLNKEASRHLNERDWVKFHRSLKNAGREEEKSIGMRERSVRNATRRRYTVPLSHVITFPCLHVMFARNNDMAFYRSIQGTTETLAKKKVQQ